MKLPFASLAVALALGMPSALFAGSQDVVAENAWARASIGTSRPGAAYMTLRNTGEEPVVLTGLSTDLAMMPDIHRTTTDAQGMTSMAPAGELEIASGEAIALEPGGLHVMLMQLQRPMVEGESFALTLEFADGGEMQVDVPILGIAARGPEE
ncbi:copper chaperone PCu(A)C [Tranquillimonas alkanivorans]|uniref:Copper(I)-binding protein n=1 Tax=Tranquillimonas alkanivorans TaxID=441119 RepID=A0A1I5U8Q4_9RHOB|nr:copper chaperone PCu(A)C [Tranquillimonas alkanivorans]SFP91671.1 hypothetical protein SAMN04488047_11842 [Tranquillimonas alkanivorans]